MFLVDQLQLVATECIIDEGNCHHNRTANGAYGKVVGLSSQLNEPNAT